MSEPGPISAEDVRHIAGLARLELSEEEVERFTEQLAGILGHASDVAARSTSTSWRPQPTPSG